MADIGFSTKRTNPNEKVIALAGNPNVGKSTIFNSLTGLNQHTGNWPGKTVTTAQGIYRLGDAEYLLVDLPGTYSLMAHSAEEEVARDFICFKNPDAVVVVCDATCLERNLNLVLQTIEITNNVIVCINLLDEAKRKGININLDGLSNKLGVPVVGTIGRKRKSSTKLMNEVEILLNNKSKPTSIQIKYDKPIEQAIELLEPTITKKVGNKINSRWLALKLLDHDDTLINSLNEHLGYEILTDNEIKEKLSLARKLLDEKEYKNELLRDKIVSRLVLTAQDIASENVTFQKENYNDKDRKIDKILTSKLTGYPIMILMLMVVFWLTITGANYPSQLLSKSFFWLENQLLNAFHFIGAPKIFSDILIFGIYRVLSFVVSVMLPPMAIFFPLFTLLEDLGYLPRVAFNLDKHFKKCSACGKQALTMCMGFGCNAAGVIGCRIIDSPRERLIAIITNNFVPCNGRFPTLIAIITMFFAVSIATPFRSIFSALMLTCVIVIGVMLTFLSSKFLSKTILKGLPSSFTLELPPYRKPQVGKILLRSIFDRVLFVLGRAVVIAAPAGLIIWTMANITINEITLLTHCSDFLDPFARLLGMDGVILLAFILGLPANEIVVPIIVMSYMSTGTIVELDNLWALKELFVSNGWTWITAVSTMLFCLVHWPCSTTLLTIKKETQSIKWTAISFILPTLMGMIACFTFTTLARLFI